MENKLSELLAELNTIGDELQLDYEIEVIAEEMNVPVSMLKNIGQALVTNGHLARLAMIDPIIIDWTGNNAIKSSQVSAISIGTIRTENISTNGNEVTKKYYIYATLATGDDIELYRSHESYEAIWDIFEWLLYEITQKTSMIRLDEKKIEEVLVSKEVQSGQVLA